MHPNTIKELGVGECVFSLKLLNLVKVVKVPLPSFHQKNAPWSVAPTTLSQVPFNPKRRNDEISYPCISSFWVRL